MLNKANYGSVEKQNLKRESVFLCLHQLRLFRVSIEGREGKGREGKAAQSCLSLRDPMDCGLPGFSVHGIFQARVLEVGCHFLLQDIVPTRGIEPRSPALQADALPSEPPGKLRLGKPWS